jgi:hypothetical protein
VSAKNSNSDDRYPTSLRYPGRWILTTSLTSKEIERRRILVSKFKEDSINHARIDGYFEKGEAYSRRGGNQK